MTLRKTNQPTVKCLHLTKLNLSQFPFSEQKLIEILTACPNLTTLDLSFCQVTNKILQHLPKTLQSLNFKQCDITDKGLQLLQPLVHLTHLNLSDCKNITDDGLKHLKALSALQELKLINCDQLTQAGYDHLKPLVPITREESTDGGLLALIAGVGLAALFALTAGARGN